MNFWIFLEGEGEGEGYTKREGKIRRYSFPRLFSSIFHIFGLQPFQLIAKPLPESRILDMFCNHSTENESKEIKNKLYSFLLFHWFLLLRIKCFVQITKMHLNKSSQKNQGFLQNKEFLLDNKLIVCKVYNY